MYAIRKVLVSALFVIGAYSYASDNAQQDFLDSHQYTINGINRYEKIFGKDFISVGGLETTRDITRLLDLKTGERVLDVGSGAGGSAFYMTERYGVIVEGVDLSSNMVSKASTRAAELGIAVNFIHQDILKADYQPDSFDVIYSRDSILHIADKDELFEKLYRWLKPGGRLLITDYATGEGPFRPEFLDYLTDRQYKLTTIGEYKSLIERAGFMQVVAENRTWQFVDSLEQELSTLKKERDDFLRAHSEQDYQDLVDGWTAKLDRAARKEQIWGLFLAKKPTE